MVVCEKCERGYIIPIDRRPTNVITKSHSHDKLFLVSIKALYTPSSYLCQVDHNVATLSFVSSIHSDRWCKG